MPIHRTLRVAGTFALALLYCCTGGPSPVLEPTPEDFVATPRADGPPTDLGAIPDHWETSDLEATPRADQNLELLALSVSGTVVARQEIYDRVVRDVTAIRASHPEIEGINYLWRDSGNQLLMQVDSRTFAAIEQHAYHDWDGLNARWRLVDSHILVAALQSLILQFNGIYYMAAVAREYAALSGVAYAEPNSGLGNGSTICLTIECDWYRYVFDRTGGDCPAGCTSHHEFGFSTDNLGAIAFEGEWDSTTSGAMPDFIRRFGRRAGTSCYWW